MFSLMFASWITHNCLFYWYKIFQWNTLYLYFLQHIVRDSAPGSFSLQKKIWKSWSWNYLLDATIAGGGTTSKKLGVHYKSSNGN